MARTVRVAIIGSGLAGLTAAYLLTKEYHDGNNLKDGDVKFEVHLFEKTATLGMDSSSISLPVPGQEKDWRVDVPMRSFQGGYYPQLIALYKRLGVPFRKTDFTYSFSQLSMFPTRKITAMMIYNGSSGLGGVSMPSGMDPTRSKDTQPLGPVVQLVFKALSIGVFIFFTIRILLCYVRLLFLCIPLRRDARLETMTYGEWAKVSIPRGRLARWSGLDSAWEHFTTFVLVPLFSAVCTASERDILNHPVEEFIDYIWLTLGTHHYAALNGVRDVVSRLVSSVEHIHLSSPITAILPDSENPSLASVQCNLADGTKIYSGFNHIIFATQASRAVPLLSSYAESSSRREFINQQIVCLQAFYYTPTIVINHTDDTLLPDNPRDRRDLNLIQADTRRFPSGSESARCVSPAYTMATHVLPRPKGFPAHFPAVLQTTNPIVEPREGRILSVARLERAMMTVESKRALKQLYLPEQGRRWWNSSSSGRLGPLQGGDDAEGPGIWICGSYAYAGIPLLEGCVVSARMVVEKGILEREGVAIRSNT